MDFFEAMRAIAQGKKVRRVMWPEGEHGLLEGSYLTIVRNGTGSHQWLVNDGDMQGVDWVIVQ